MQVSQRTVRTQARRLQSVSSISRGQIQEIQNQLKHGAERYTDQTKQNGKNGVSRDGLRRLFDDLFTEGWSHTAQITDVLFDSLDVDGTGELEVVDILRALALMKARTLQYFIREIFTLFDADSSGGLDRKQVKHLFEWLYALNYTHPPDAAEIDAFVESSFENVDLDSNGVVDLEELTSGVSHIPLITACFVRSHETLQLQATSSADNLIAMGTTAEQVAGGTGVTGTQRWRCTFDVLCKSLQRALCVCDCFARPRRGAQVEEKRPLLSADGQELSPNGSVHEMTSLV